MVKKLSHQSKMKFIYDCDLPSLENIKYIVHCYIFQMCPLTNYSNPIKIDKMSTILRKVLKIQGMGSNIYIYDKYV